jgi:hypothetical protein
MRILNSNEVYDMEKDKDNNQSLYNFLKECRDTNLISEKKYEESMEEFNRIYRLRHNLGNIDKNFTEIFSIQGKGKIAGFANMMGAEMAGLEHEGSIVLCTNVEMGINFSVVNPKKENVESYITLMDLIGKGLENPNTFKEVFKSTNALVEENSPTKLKM